MFIYYLGKIESTEDLDHLAETYRPTRVRVVHAEQPAQPLPQHLSRVVGLHQVGERLHLDAAVLGQVEGREDEVDDDGNLTRVDRFPEQLFQPLPGHVALLLLQLLLELNQLAAIHQIRSTACQECKTLVCVTKRTIKLQNKKLEKFPQK